MASEVFDVSQDAWLLRARLLRVVAKLIGWYGGSGITLLNSFTLEELAVGLARYQREHLLAHGLIELVADSWRFTPLAEKAMRNMCAIGLFLVDSAGKYRLTNAGWVSVEFIAAVRGVDDIL